MVKKRRTELDIDKDLAPEAPPPPPPAPAAPPPVVEEPPAPPLPGKKVNKIKLLILIGVGSAALILSGLLIWGIITLVSSMQSAKKAPPPPPQKKEKKVEAPKPNIYTLQPFFMPLGNKLGGKSHFVRIQFSLETSSPAVEKDIERNMTLVRENIFFLLKDKEESDFKGEDKLKQLSVDVAISINRSIQSGGIMRAYIAEIVLE